MLRRFFLLLVVFGFVVYFPSLFGQFVWDDEDFVYANRYVETCNFEKFLTDSATAGRGKVSNYYRPVQSTIYCFLHSAFGFNPFWYHLTSVLVHIAAAGAVLYFLILFTKNSQFSFLISAFFLVHPVQTEAVSYISGLSDPLFVLFGFLSLMYLMKPDLPDKRHQLLSLLFFGLSIMSKETGLVFLPLGIMVRIYQEGSFKLSLALVKSIFKNTWGYLLVTCIYLLFHVSSINQMDMKAAWGNGVYANDVFIRLATFAQNIPTYISLLLFPKDLFMERDLTREIATGIITPWVFGIIAINLGILFFLYKLTARRSFTLSGVEGPLAPKLWFFYLSFWISFVPYSGVVLVNGIFYEHFLYLPLIFFFGFLTLISPDVRRFIGFKVPERIINVSIVAWIGILIVRTLVRQYEWIDNVRFYNSTLAHAPMSIRTINGLGMEYASRGSLGEAISVYLNGISINSHVPNLYHNLANAYVAQGKIKEAEEGYLKAIEVDPNFSFSYYSLLNLYLQTGHRDKTQELLLMMRAKFPSDMQLFRLEL